MEFGLSEPQLLLQRSIRDFLAQRMPMSTVRRIMESDSGRDDRFLAELGEQGIAGILVDEEHDGAGLGLLDAVVAAQELGRAAAPVSFHTTSVLAPLLLSSCGSEEQKSTWLPRIAAGSAVVSVVRDAPASGDGRLDGHVPFVADGDAADAFIVCSEDTLHLLPCSTDGITVEPFATVDATRRVVEIGFSGVELTEGSAMTGGADDELRRAVQATQIALSADALGACQQALQIAVEYAKERRQFDRLIGSFQGVKHLLAETVAELDPVQSLLWYAAFAWDEESQEAEWLAPLLKAYTAEVATQTVTNTTQVYGGMGFTYECDMHIYFKRVGYDRQMFGKAADLRRLAADLQFAGDETPSS